MNLGWHKGFLRFLLLLPIGLQILVPVEARAEGCGVGEFCLWMDANEQGCLWHGATTHEDFRKLRYGTCPDKGLNDSVTAYRNGSAGEWYVLYENPQYKGAAYCIGPKASGNVAPGFNDKASSSAIFQNEDVTPEVVREGCKWADTD